MVITCFLYKRLCVDATTDSGTLGRLLNHSRHRPNCVAKPYKMKNIDYIILVSLCDIFPGDELTFDYGEKRQEIIDLNPWIEQS